VSRAGDRLDRVYVERWVAELDLDEVWPRVARSEG
jgi:hypothetical protein